MIDRVRFAPPRWDAAEAGSAPSPHPTQVACEENPALVVPSRAQQDLRAVAAMCDGRLPADRGMLRVAHSGGWPIPTRNGYLVAVPASGASAVAVASDTSGWKSVPLQRHGDLFVGEIRTDDRAIRYKLVVDGEFRADPWARQHTWDNFGEMSLAGSAGQHVERWPGLTDGKIAPRDVWVWVPQGTPRYHVTFLDGQNAFEPRPAHAWPGSWRLQEKVGANTLVIAVDGGDRMDANTHTSDRVKLPDGQEMTVGGGADVQSDFLASFLGPFMERQYGRARRRVVVGSSLTGLGALQLALVRHPNKFDAVIALSPTLGWGRLALSNATLREACESHPGFAPGATQVVLFSGGHANASPTTGNDSFHPTEEFHAFLAARGFSVTRLHSPGGRHGEELWGRSVRSCLDEGSRMLGVTL